MEILVAICVLILLLSLRPVQSAFRGVGGARRFLVALSLLVILSASAWECGLEASGSGKSADLFRFQGVQADGGVANFPIDDLIRCDGTLLGSRGTEFAARIRVIAEALVHAVSPMARKRLRTILRAGIRAAYTRREQRRPALTFREVRVYWQKIRAVTAPGRARGGGQLLDEFDLKEGAG